MTPAPIASLLGDNRLAALAATLLALHYWKSGLAKLADLGGGFGEARHFGLEPGAGARGGFTTAATIFAHPFWHVADPMAHFHERNTSLKRGGLIGGLMLAAILRERRT